TSPPSRFLSGCPRIYHPLSPICGSDGVTYPNKCAFCIAKRLALEICVHLDEKVPSEGSCCPEKWVPSTSQVD
uniref:Kazal-like domain-containing protein n=2 Tax=Naja naja TaxID=35670 RepID=A0A8C6V949_NAJNA